MKINSKYALFIALSTGTCTILSGCGAVSSVINHGSLTTESRMSQTIFLDPVAPKDRVIYVQVHDTSGHQVNLKSALVSALQKQGWRVTRNPMKAHDRLQVNVLQVGQAKNPDAAWASMHAGFNSVLLGGLAGVAAGYAADSAATGLGVGLGVGAVSFLADSFIKDVTYSMITDVQVSVRVRGSVSQQTRSHLSQGTQTTTVQTYQQKTHWMKYRTRIASVADKVNLKFNQAKPALVQHISQQIAGIF